MFECQVERSLLLVILGRAEGGLLSRHDAIEDCFLTVVFFLLGREACMCFLAPGPGWAVVPFVLWLGSLAALFLADHGNDYAMLI